MNKAKIRGVRARKGDPVDKVAVSTMLKYEEDNDRYLVLFDVDPTASTNDDFLNVFPKGYHGLFEFDNKEDALVCIKTINDRFRLDEENG